MNFKRLETFIWVATLGSFRKAAEHQHTTQPAISNRIAALEDELGVRLFERESGHSKLTSKGQELLPEIFVAGAGYKVRTIFADDAQGARIAPQLHPGFAHCGGHFG